MQGRLFPNQLPDCLEAELRFVAQLGVTPFQVGDIGFDALLNQGTIKWAAIENGTLLIVPKYVDGQEIPHTALTHGEAVLAAGEAEIITSNARTKTMAFSQQQSAIRNNDNCMTIAASP